MSADGWGAVLTAGLAPLLVRRARR
jgi:hypothetical protein